MPVPKRFKADHARFGFYLMARFHAVRYLLSNTRGREDGAEKAERHKHLCETFMAFNYLIEPDDAWAHGRKNTRKCYGDPRKRDGVWLTGDGPYDFIHDHTQKLTSHLDTAIGMPTEKGVQPDYDKLTVEFLAHFHNLASEAALHWTNAVDLDKRNAQ